MESADWRTFRERQNLHWLVDTLFSLIYQNSKKCDKILNLISLKQMLKFPFVYNAKYSLNHIV